MGKRAVYEVFAYQKERIYCVLVARGFSDPLVAQLEKAGITVKFVAKAKLYHKTKSENHGSIIAEVTERKPIKLEKFLREKHKKQTLRILALDQVFDPQNVGAILRAAECFGVNLVIIPKKNGCKITPVVTKASSGASELLPIYFGSLLESIKLCQNYGIKCFAAEKTKSAHPMSSVSFPNRTLLVVGSEGEGIRKIISEHCDDSVYIPLKGKIDSLNVSQATAILLYKICS